MLKNLALLSLAGTLAGFAAGPNAPELKTRPTTAPPLDTTVKIVQANYCFAKYHGLEYERLPTPPLVLQLKVQVSYHDTVVRPVILPLEHEVTVYTALKPGLMKILPNSVVHPENSRISETRLSTLAYLPANVSPQNPINPTNDVFTVIPAGGDISAPLVEDLSIPIYKKSIKQRVDLRGHKLYLRMQFDHRPLSPQLEAAISDTWSRFGAPWTGRLRTNTFVLDVPAKPDAKECVDVKLPHYPHTGLDKLQGAQTR